MAWRFYNSSGVAKTGDQAITGRLSVTQVLHVRDEKAQNTTGGTFTSGAWRTRVLNTSKTNTITGASLASNQITLPAGTYWVDATAPAYTVGRHRVKLYNTTGAADVLLGTSSFSGGLYDYTLSVLSGQFTLTATSVLELQHRCETTLATHGFGVESNFATEVYSDVVIWKTA